MRHILTRLTLAAVIAVSAIPGSASAAEARVRPQTFQAHSWCGTIELLEGLQPGGAGPPDDGAALRPQIQEEEVILSADGRFQLHFSGRLFTGAPDARLRRTRHNRLPDPVEHVLAALSAARVLVVESAGWADPQPQRPLEVYLLAGRAPAPSRTLPGEDLFLSAEEGSGAFMVLSGTPQTWALQVLHQYLHAVQIGYSARESPWLYEASALYVEERLSGSGAVPARLVSRRMAAPHLSLSSGISGEHGGGVAFLAHVAESFGDDLLRRTWELAAREFGDNSLRALDGALRLTGQSSFLESWRVFSVLNGFPDPSQRPEGLYGSLSVPVPAATAARVVTTLPDGEAGANGLLVEPLGAAYVHIRDLAEAGAVRIELETEGDAVLEADALVSWRHAPGGWLAVPFRIQDGRGELGIPVESGSQVVVVVRNHKLQPGPAARIGFSIFAEPGFPYELSFLSAEASPGRIDLSWGSESEQRMYGWVVYRGTDPQGPFLPVNRFPIPSMGDSLAPLAYQFTDAEVDPGTLYYYLVEGITVDGLARRSPVLARRAVAAPVPVR